MLLLAVTSSSLLVGLFGSPELGLASGVAVGTGFTLQFVGALLRYRVIDEHKDAAKDRVLYPDRPVPSGAITLARLRGIGVAAVGVELLGVAVVAVSMASIIAAVAYLPFAVFSILSAFDFFAPALAKRFSLEFSVHQLAYPLLAAWAALALGAAWPHAVFGAAAYAAALAAAEVARKFEPRTDGDGVTTRDTYAAVWGRPAALLVLGGLLAAAAVLAWMATASVWTAVVGGVAAVACAAVGRITHAPTVVTLVALVGFAVAVHV